MTMETAAGLNLIGYQDAITREMERLYPDYLIYEDTLDDDSILWRDWHGKMEAYFVLRYGPLMPARRGRSLIGARHDEYYGTVDIMGVASKGRIARAITQAAGVDMMTFRPDGLAPMSLQDDGGMFAAFVVSSNEARPTRSIASQRLRFPVNNRDVGATPRGMSTP